MAALPPLDVLQLVLRNRRQCRVSWHWAVDPSTCTTGRGRQGTGQVLLPLGCRDVGQQALEGGCARWVESGWPLVRGLHARCPVQEETVSQQNRTTGAPARLTCASAASRRATALGGGLVPSGGSGRQPERPHRTVCGDWQSPGTDSAAGRASRRSLRGSEHHPWPSRGCTGGPGDPPSPVSATWRVCSGTRPVGHKNRVSEELQWQRERVEVSTQSVVVGN